MRARECGTSPNSVEDLVAGAIRNNDVLIPFGSVDPWHERRAVHRVHELVRDYGVKGFKFHPSMQAFEPNDRRFYPIYEAIAEAGVPALFHTGQTGIGAGLPGGHRIKLRYSDPMLLDDVAADFPELTIVMAHPAVPWVDSQIAIATHKTNVYIDLCGWSPKYFPPQLVRAASRQLRTKVLFGTDYPYIQMDRWRRDFEGLDIDPAVVPLIYKEQRAEGPRDQGLNTYHQRHGSAFCLRAAIFDGVRPLNGLLVAAWPVPGASVVGLGLRRRRGELFALAQAIAVTFHPQDG